ncbi:MAG: hypothetical protein UW69_C0008G0035 [Microgenomates group bacterium GW2011_GWA2_44_7]|uniref:Uncharacterized protein n=1 Tax=Candidatus Woesebacteria bacterium GW2011_GWA1_43_12 TaxID=1618557 RepID=A0A0G1F5T5_9BACT|nr:MAG: hypothetical protein UV66_C0002G0028 [Candidatus Woesebacteria bacterium GW2011_GWA1_43_12]KKT75884.1 MAG: hypothetical protein UW69_C0008G0035 [Microgenomates group bacterium GW2011_GWA2_44_7]KKT78496.1 MAG: hypothetical protein UW73_C0002G0027 [Microgenomates group bacterium GW2011_GWB1_44_8]
MLDLEYLSRLTHLREIVRTRGVAWPNTRPCQGRDRRSESGRVRSYHNLLLP